MKKIFMGIFAVVIALALTGCGRWGIFGSEVDDFLERGAADDGYNGYGDSDDYGDYGDYGDYDDSDDGETYYGIVGETMSNVFFDFVVQSADKVDSYEGYTPSDGMALIDTVIEVTNTDDDELPMSIYDFQIQWGDYGDDEFDYEVEALWDTGTTMPEHYTLPVGESNTWHVVYEIPVSALSDDIAITYLEEYADGSEGDLYAVFFTLDGSAPSEGDTVSA